MLREDLQAREDARLAPCAMRSARSRGRDHAEPEADYRTCYQRDRDRVIHCKAFRRLEYKTQVFLNHEGDHYRTRLTHTIEVTQIGRTIARALGINEDLVEAVALAHDVGHTPFGHSGEDALRDLMAEHGGFEHNAQGLRVVELLERQYAAFPGLNLTYEVRECMVKHHTRWDRPTSERFGEGQAPLEGQVVAVADSIAYDNHDLQDGLEAGILTEDLLQETPLWREACEAVFARAPDMAPEHLHQAAGRYLTNLLVTDVIEHTLARIRARGVDSPEAVCEQPDCLVEFSEALQQKKAVLEDFLYQTLYRDYRVVRMTNSAQRFVKSLFDAYVGDPRQLPPGQTGWVEEVGLHRAVCDYIAGMTDRYAQDQYIQLFHPYQRL